LVTIYNGEASIILTVKLLISIEFSINCLKTISWEHGPSIAQSTGKCGCEHHTSRALQNQTTSINWRSTVKATRIAAAVAVVASLGAGSAMAATFSSLSFNACDGPFPNSQGPNQPDTRNFTVTIADGTASCVAAGLGNLQGNQAEADTYLPGYTYVEKNEGGDSGWIDSVSGLNGGSGTITLAANFWSNYSEIGIGLKSGEGRYDPDWVIFKITGSTDTTIAWTVSAQGLSHVNLYAVPKEQEIPVPGTLGLIGLGLAGLGLIGRKKVF
jgi:PEP-CTERM motif